MPFLCASLLYVITKIILCLCDCVCVCSTGSSSDALTLPTIDITMPSYRATTPLLRPPPHAWKTTIVLSYSCSGQLVVILTNTGSIKAESGHISLCMCVYLCVFGDSAEMMAKQSGVHTLTCSSPDTCEDKHRFP